VWLYTHPDEYMRRLIAIGDVRPMQHQDDAMADLRRILAEREQFYSKAHVSIDTSGKSIEECVNELLGVAPEGLRNNMSDVLKA
jgi:XRE family aerobic/anaerobic benzoate catabolism transcriptional regulator